MQAISARARKPESRYSQITRADSVFYWNFTLADQIIDSIVIRNFWEIPEDMDAQDAADQVVGEIHEIFVHFMDFAGEFVWKYFER